MPMTDDHRAALLDGNRAYADAFEDHDAPKEPARRLFVLTCMDTRVDPLRALGLQLGDVHVIRNAGGRVTDDVVRSLVLSSTLLGTEHVAVIHHTDCGLGSTTDEQVRADLAGHGVDIGELWTGAFADLDDSVRADVDDLRGLAVLRDRVTVSGYVYDVATGRLRPVDG
jgi:carbonic anhydrase